MLIAVTPTTTEVTVTMTPGSTNGESVANSVVCARFYVYTCVLIMLLC